MLFNTPAYAYFLLVVVALYFALPHKWQNRMLLVASYVFYGSWDVRFLSLIVASTVVDYGAGLWIKNSRVKGRHGHCRAGLLLSLFTNLGLLGVFKYYNFFVGSAEALLETMGVSVGHSTLNIILPVGISFYTFQTLSYTIDVYRGNIEPTRRFLDFALFVAFFPQLVAGPIERASRLLPQVQAPRHVTREHITRGLYLILVGLVRKVVIADNAGLIADRYFSDPGAHTTLELIVGLGLYALQIYGDFAGYSNIARGSASLMGFDLIRNFKHPYFSKNISEFWRRWHISLSFWLRDYLYISLGGNRKGSARTCMNLMATMLLGGLWHGASWNFVFWGGLHGLYLMGHRLASAIVSPPEKGEGGVRHILWSACSMMLTFGLSAFAWLFFRLTTLDGLAAYFRGIGRCDFDGQLSLVPLAILGTLTLIVDVPQAVTEDEFCFQRLSPVLVGGLAALAIALVALAGGGQQTPFIYFQF